MVLETVRISDAETARVYDVIKLYTFSDVFCHLPLSGDNGGLYASGSYSPTPFVEVPGLFSAPQGQQVCMPSFKDNAFAS
jgi:hypothetical protein